jgi:hypothetical protein
MLGRFFKPLETSPHDQYWIYLITTPLTFGDLKHLTKLLLQGFEKI